MTADAFRPTVDAGISPGLTAVAMTVGDYMPVLLTKRGERTALQSCPPQVRDRMTPLLVVPPPDLDGETGTVTRPVQQHLSNLPGQLVASWGAQPAFIDLQQQADDPMDDGRHPLVWIIEQSLDLGLPLVPVASPTCSPGYLDAVRQVVRTRGADLCLRLPLSHWASAVGHGRVVELATSLGASQARTHLVLDLGDDVGEAAVAAVTGELRSHGPWSAWKSLVLIGAAMPKTIPAGQGVHRLPRREWSIFRQMLRTGRLQRRPVFGDYGVAHPDPTFDVPPQVLSISASLRYTTPEDWLVVRGELFKGNGGRGLGSAAVPPVCTELAAQPAFAGRHHCDLEAWTEDVAAGLDTGGNPERWRMLATRHHLQVVIEQQRYLAAPSVVP